VLFEMARFLPLLALATALAAPAAALPHFVGGPMPSFDPRAVGWGDVRLEVTVGADGLVSAIETLRTSPPYTEALVAAVSSWRFEPAEADGVLRQAPVLVMGIFRPRVLYDTPALGTPPVDVVEPSSRVPAPLEIPRAVYPARALRDGYVLVETVVAIDGAVERTTVVAATSPAFEGSALSAAARTRFRPAEADGRPVPGRAYLLYGFRSPAVTR
jgi:TonB family protein